MIKNRRRQQGFTLIEIIIVVFILSLLAAVVVPRLMGRTDEARVTEAKVQIRNLETALKLFKLDNGFYPSTEQGLEALVEEPTVGKEARNSLGADGQEGGEGFDADITSWSVEN
jgi:general secretion pathway protein G